MIMIMLCHVFMTVNVKYKNNIELRKHCGMPHYSDGEQHFDLYKLHKTIVNMYF